MLKQCFTQMEYKYRQKNGTPSVLQTAAKQLHLRPFMRQCEYFFTTTRTCATCKFDHIIFIYLFHVEKRYTRDHVQAAGGRVRRGTSCLLVLML